MCGLIALFQVIFQILIASKMINCNNQTLKFFGFGEAEKTIDYILFLGIDLLLFLSAIVLNF